MEIKQIIEQSIVIEHAKKIKAYCKTNRRCNTCVFYNGTCGLNFHPCDWDFKKLNYEVTNENDKNAKSLQRLSE